MKEDWRDNIESIREESRLSGGLREIETLLREIDRPKKKVEELEIRLENTESELQYPDD